MGKEGKREIWTILGKFGQVRTQGQGNKLEKWGEKAERIRFRGCTNGEKGTKI